MRIIRSTEAMPVLQGRMMLFGPPGIGKTTLGQTADEPLTLDFDRGSHRVQNRKDGLAISTWADVDELMAKPEALEPYKTIVVDTVGRCLDFLTADIIDDAPKLGRDGVLTQQGWGVLKGRFKSWMDALGKLGKDIVLIAHEKEEKDGDLRIVRADIPGGSYGEVMKLVDFVGYVSIQGKDRALDFNPTERWNAKNPAGWPTMVVPHFAKEPRFLGTLLLKGKEALGKIGAESAGLASVVTEWASAISAYDTTEEMNAALPKIDALPPMVKAQVKKLLWDRAKVKGFSYDATAKAIVGAPATQTQVA
jgi:hypothetical protein